MVKIPRDTTNTVTDNYGWAKTGAHYCWRHLSRHRYKHSYIFKHNSQSRAHYCLRHSDKFTHNSKSGRQNYLRYMHSALSRQQHKLFPMREKIIYIQTVLFRCREYISKNCARCCVPKYSTKFHQSTELADIDPHFIPAN